MARIKRSVVSRARRKEVLKMAKGYRGRAKNCFSVAIEKVEKGLQYAYRDRRTKKRTARSLWIQRINAAARLHNITYGKLIASLKQSNITIDRKMLANLALHNMPLFTEIVEKARATTAI